MGVASASVASGTLTNLHIYLLRVCHSFEEKKPLKKKITVPQYLAGRKSSFSVFYRACRPGKQVIDQNLKKHHSHDIDSLFNVASE